MNHKKELLRGLWVNVQQSKRHRAPPGAAGAGGKEGGRGKCLEAENRVGSGIA